jgi:hypothetical protein
MSTLRVELSEDSKTARLICTLTGRSTPIVFVDSCERLDNVYIAGKGLVGHSLAFVMLTPEEFLEAVYAYNTHVLE